MLNSVSRIAQLYLRTATSSLDGKTKLQVLRIINNLIGPHTKGLFRDSYWAPIKAIQKELEGADVPADLIYARYEKENGIDVRKVWKYTVYFVNQNGRQDKVYISITASGAGSTEDPLSVYDVVAYAS